MRLSERLEGWQAVLGPLKEVCGAKRFEVDIDSLLFLVSVARAAVKHGLIEDVRMNKEDCEDLGTDNPEK